MAIYLLFCTSPENLKDYDTFIFLNDMLRQIYITDIKVMPKKVIIKIKDYNDITTSESILGKEILIDKSDMPILDEGEYYWRELEGLEVVTSEEKFLGVVDFIFNNGSNSNCEMIFSIFVIAMSDNPDSMFNETFVNQFCKPSSQEDEGMSVISKSFTSVGRSCAFTL